MLIEIPYCVRGSKKKCTHNNERMSKKRIIHSLLYENDITTISLFTKGTEGKPEGDRRSTLKFLKVKHNRKHWPEPVWTLLHCR